MNRIFQKRLAEGMDERRYIDIIDRLRVGNAWWLVASERSVEVIIALAIDSEKEKIVFGQWKHVVGDDRKSVPIKTQEVVITRSGDGKVQVTGPVYYPVSLSLLVCFLKLRMRRI